MTRPLERSTFKFGPYAVDVTSGELRKNGVKVRLQEKSLRVLEALAERQGEVVTREELHERLWPKDTFVDFEDGLHTAVKKLRDALADDPENPKYIQTIRSKGYRFLVPVEIANAGEVRDGKPELPGTQGAAKTKAPAPRWWKRIGIRAAAGAVIVACVLLGVAISRWRRVAKPQKNSERIKLAVLPFENLTGDNEDDYISDGFTEEIITQFGEQNRERIAVIARTSAMAYKGSQKSIRDIAQELAVDYILEGSVRKTGQGFRITAQLIRADDQTHLWAHEYDRSFEGLVQIQEEVARSVSQETLVNLEPDSGTAAANNREVNADSYRSYLKGRYFLAERSQEALNKAVAAFKDSLDHDAQYAPAYAGMADAYNLLVYYGYFPGPEGIGKAKTAAEKAIALDANLARGHASLGYSLFMWEWKWTQAEREFQRALELDPNLSTAHHWYAQLLTAQGRVTEALEQIRIAEELDPRSLIVTTAHGYISYFARQYDAAAEECRVALQRSPDFVVAHAVLGLALEQQHTDEQAIAEFKKALELSGSRSAPFLDYLGHAYALSGKQAEAQAILKELDEELVAKGSGPAFRAATLARLGRKQEAIEALEEGFVHGDGPIIWLLVDPRYDPLRGDPRYARLLERLFPDKQNVRGPVVASH